MSNQLATLDPNAGLAEIQNLGSIFYKSGFFQDVRDANQAIVKILAGREYGFGEFASMTGIHIIKGRPSVGAGLMASRIKSSGKYTFRVKQHNAQVCTLAFFERNSAGDFEEIGVETFTIEEAKKAGGQNLYKWAKNMLFARCLSNGYRFHCPDVFTTPVYVPEELGAPVDSEGNVVDDFTAQKGPSLPTPGLGKKASPTPAEAVQEGEVTEIAPTFRNRTHSGKTPADLTTAELEKYIEYWSANRDKDRDPALRAAVEKELADRARAQESFESVVAEAAAIEAQKAAQPASEPTPEPTPAPKVPRYIQRVFATASEFNLPTTDEHRAARMAKTNQQLMAAGYEPVKSWNELGTQPADFIVERMRLKKLGWGPDFVADGDPLADLQSTAAPVADDFDDSEPGVVEGVVSDAA